MCPVLAITGLRTFINHLPDRRNGTAFLILAAPVVDDVDDQMHLARGDAIGRKEVESIFSMDARGDFQDLHGVCSLGWANRREEEMGPVPLPIQPLQFADFRDSGAYINARVEIMARRHVFGEYKAYSSDSLKFFRDNPESIVDLTLGTVERPCVSVLVPKLWNILSEDYRKTPRSNHRREASRHAAE